jgi:hypothetical protein
MKRLINPVDMVLTVLLMFVLGFFPVILTKVVALASVVAWRQYRGTSSQYVAVYLWHVA